MPKKTKNLKEKKSVSNKNEIIIAQEEPVAFENMPIIFSWTTMDFIKKPLTEFYFTAAAVGAMAMIGWGLYNRSFVMVVTFIMMVIVIILVLNEEPKKIEVVVSEKGIDVNNEHYNFSEFKSFKISHTDELPTLILKPRKSFSLFKNIYIKDEPVNDLESFLGIYLEKEEDAQEG
ncbi:MAG: hypothetical protein Q8N37_03760 [bacterium]|nr:hypothetical protein [bacterium]